MANKEGDGCVDPERLDSGNVISFGDHLITRKRKRWDHEACKHLHVTLDDGGEVIVCSDCGKYLSAYWVLKNLSESINAKANEISAERKQLEQDKRNNLHLKAAKNLESIWKGRHMLPVCPHCKNGITADEALHCGGIGKEYDAMLKRRRKEVE